MPECFTITDGVSTPKHALALKFHARENAWKRNQEWLTVRQTIVASTLKICAGMNVCLEGGSVSPRIDAFIKALLKMESKIVKMVAMRIYKKIRG